MPANKEDNAFLTAEQILPFLLLILREPGYRLRKLNIDGPVSLSLITCAPIVLLSSPEIIMPHCFAVLANIHFQNELILRLVAGSLEIYMSQKGWVSGAFLFGGYSGDLHE